MKMALIEIDGVPPGLPIMEWLNNQMVSIQVYLLKMVDLSMAMLNNQMVSMVIMVKPSCSYHKYDSNWFTIVIPSGY